MTENKIQLIRAWATQNDILLAMQRKLYITTGKKPSLYLGTEKTSYSVYLKIVEKILSVQPYTSAFVCPASVKNYSSISSIYFPSGIKGERFSYRNRFCPVLRVGEAVGQWHVLRGAYRLTSTELIDPRPLATEVKPGEIWDIKDQINSQKLAVLKLSDELEKLWHIEMYRAYKKKGELQDELQ